MEKENSFFVEEKKNGEGKGGKHLEKEKIFLRRSKIKKEKEEHFWRRKIVFLLLSKRKTEKEKEDNICRTGIFWRRKSYFCREEKQRRRTHLFVEEKEKGNICWRRRKDTEKENIIEKENWRGWTGGWRGRRLYTRSSRI